MLASRLDSLPLLCSLLLGPACHLFSRAGRFCPPISSPALSVCCFHAALFLKIQFCSHWPQNRMFAFLPTCQGCRHCVSSESNYAMCSKNMSCSSPSHGIYHNTFLGLLSLSLSCNFCLKAFDSFTAWAPCSLRSLLPRGAPLLNPSALPHFTQLLPCPSATLCPHAAHSPHPGFRLLVLAIPCGLTGKVRGSELSLAPSYILALRPIRGEGEIWSVSI